MTKAADSLSAVSYDQLTDLLEASLKKGFLTEEKKPYQILVSEILPTKYHDITPEEYRYFFVVSDSSSQVRKP